MKQRRNRFDDINLWHLRSSTKALSDTNYVWPGLSRSPSKSSFSGWAWLAKPEVGHPPGSMIGIGSVQLQHLSGKISLLWNPDTRYCFCLCSSSFSNLSPHKYQYHGLKSDQHVWSWALVKPKDTSRHPIILGAGKALTTDLNVWMSFPRFETGRLTRFAFEIEFVAFKAWNWQLQMSWILLGCSIHVPQILVLPRLPP